MSGAFSLVNMLADSVGPGTIGLREGDSPIFLVISSLTALCFILLHTTWGVTFFYSLDSKKYYLTFLVVLCHLASSLFVSNNMTSRIVN